MGKRTLQENYRPVGILPNLSKIYEKIMFTQMTKFLETIFSRYQCGFRKGFKYTTMSSSDARKVEKFY